MSEADKSGAIATEKVRKGKEGGLALSAREI